MSTLPTGSADALPSMTRVERERLLADPSAMRGVKKENLPSKVCAACGRPFTWRKKWARDWEHVKFCSDACRRRGGQAPRPACAHDAEALLERLETVDSAKGRKRLRAHLAMQPYPHYEPHPSTSGLLIRTDATGMRAAGRFVNRKFVRTDR